MNKIHIAIIIVSTLIILAVTGFLIYKNWEFENDDWLNISGDEMPEESICNDVLESDKGSEYIEFVLQREIMFTDENNNFYPDNEINLIDFLRILARVNFPRMDIDNMSGEGIIELFVKNNVVNEGEITEEKYDSKVTNYQVAILLSKADMKIRNYEQMICEINFKDLSGINEVGKTLIAHGIKRGFINTDDKYYFRPDEILTNRKVAEYIYLYINK